MLGATLVKGKVRDADISGGSGGKLNLGGLSGFAKTLDSSLILRAVNAGLGFEFTEEVILDLDIEILTTEGSITVGGLDLEYTTRDLKNRDIVGATT